MNDEELLKRRERYNCEVPPEVLYLTAGVDTQDDRFEIPQGEKICLLSVVLCRLLNIGRCAVVAALNRKNTAGK